MAPDEDMAEAMMEICRRAGREYTLFIPSRPGCPVFNPLGGDPARVAAGVQYAFEKLFASEKDSGFFKTLDRMLTMMIIRAVKEALPDAGFVDPLMVLLDPGFLTTVIRGGRLEGDERVSSGVKTRIIREYFEKDMGAWEDKKKNEYTIGLKNQLMTFLSNPHIKRAISGKSDFNIQDVMNTGKVLIVALPVSELGPLGNVLGTFLLQQVILGAYSRRTKADRTHPFVCYIDECHNYVNPELGSFLAQARKYRVAMALSHQNLSQLGNQNDRMRQEILANTRQKVVYGGLEFDDAEYFSKTAGSEKRMDRSWSYGGNSCRTPQSESCRMVEERRFTATQLREMPRGQILAFQVVEGSVKRTRYVEVTPWR